MSDDLTEGQTAVVPDGFVINLWQRGFGRTVGPFYSSRDPATNIEVMAFRVEEHHANGMNNCHGGMLMSFADMAWGRVISNQREVGWVTIRHQLLDLAAHQFAGFVAEYFFGFRVGQEYLPGGIGDQHAVRRRQTLADGGDPPLADDHRGVLQRLPGPGEGSGAHDGEGCRGKRAVGRGEGVGLCARVEPGGKRAGGPVLTTRLGGSPRCRGAR